MIQRLLLFNDSVGSTIPVTRGNKWVTKDWVNVACADIGGAYCGGKVGAVIGGKVGLGLGNPITGAAFGATLGAITVGAFNSWRAAPNCSVSNSYETFNIVSCGAVCFLNDDFSIDMNNVQFVDGMTKNKIMLDSSSVVTVKLTESQLNIGKIHNLLLASVTGSIKAKEQDVITKKQINGSCIYRFVESGYNKELYSTSMDLLNQNRIDSKVDYVMKLFLEVFSDYSLENTDVVFLINRYKDIIEVSDELSEEEKEFVYASLATALYSFNYWNVTCTK